jgi:hemoglobin
MFFTDVGGKPVLEKVHKIFYDKVYAHPWLGKFFVNKDQKLIESQQTNFMTQNFGGPVVYSGKIVGPAHKHMFITEELFNLREKLLEESLIEAGVSPEHRATWHKIDGAFRSEIVKGTVEDCQKRFFTDELMIFENPNKKKFA